MVITTVLGKIISIFIMMAVGIICYKMNIIDRYAKDKLSHLSTWIVCPMLIFMSFQMDYDEELLKKMLIVFGLSILSFIISIILANIFLKDKEGYDNAVERFGVIFTNCGFIGIPLGSAIFGNIGVIYATMFVASFHIFCWTYGITLLDHGKFQLKKLMNPCLTAVILGIIFFVFQALSLAIAILQLLLKKFGNNDSCLLALVSAFFMIGSFMITSFVGLAFILNLFDISLIPPQD